MDTDAEVLRELDSLAVDVAELLSLAHKDTPYEFGGKYQMWYSRATKLVELLGPDRLEEFRRYYLIDARRKALTAASYVIQDYILCANVPLDYLDRPQWDDNAVVTVLFCTQCQILESLRSRIGTVLADVQGHIRAQVEDDELAVAEKLLRVSLRGAGAVAGVILEGHLDRVARNHRIPIVKKDPTLSDLNDCLKAGSAYDVPKWRKIQLLADVRNLCDHKKDREPTRDEVTELIAGVRMIVKTVF